MKKCQILKSGWENNWSPPQIDQLFGLSNIVECVELGILFRVSFFNRLWKPVFYYTELNYIQTCIVARQKEAPIKIGAGLPKLTAYEKNLF